MKTTETLVSDIYNTISTGEGWDDDIAQWVLSNLALSFQRQFSGSRGTERGRLRLSQLGTPCERQLYYSTNIPDNGSALAAHTKFKFVYGDVIESLLLGLAKASGHTVVGCQDRLEVSGVVGHRDCVIDGMLVDVKSASTFSVDKFRNGGLRANDPFGYLSQLSSYLWASQSDSLVTNKKEAGFLVADKTLGHIIFEVYDLTEEMSKKEEEIARKKKIVSDPLPPPKGFDEVPMGKSGNMKLDTNCSYCNFNRICWPGVRVFAYSSGPVYLTKIEKEPDVFEIT
jgi:hypothetical protein